jgi:predicted acylesterase/phospholipase RssA
MPKPLQIAIQGGGAKIFSLLAAMQAVQEYQNAGKIKVTRIAGTSAGAFAGCLFGAGIDLKGFREELRVGLAKRIISPFTAPSTYQYLALLWGTPLWSTTHLRSSLEDIFTRHTKKPTLRIKDLQLEVLVTHAKLNSRRRDVHQPDDLVIDALLDSSGIPFCFRTWKGPHANIVDGGICENLPVEILAQRSQPADGSIVAISFEPSLPTEPTNLAQFSMALLDTAIDSSMANARFRLGAESVLSLPQPVGTFEFEKALKDGLDVRYDEAMRLTKEFLDTIIDPNESAIGDPWSDQNIQNLLTLGEMFNMQHKSSTMKYRKQRLEVTAYSLKDPTMRDQIDYSTQFDTVDNPIYCHSIALATTEHKTYINKSRWRLYDPKNSPVKILHIPMKDPTAPHLRALLLFFVPILPAGTGPYTLIVKDFVKDVVAPLRTPPKYEDELAIKPRRTHDKIDKVEFVIHIPEEYEKATMLNKSGENWGRAVDSPEVTKDQPPGFRSLGWEGYDIDPSTRCAIDVKLNI